MENYRAILSEQKEALTKDIETLVTEIKSKELELEALKDKKSEAASALRSIEKKLAKV